MSICIPYAHHCVDDTDIKAVAFSLRENLLTRGPIVAQFEAAVASYVQAKYAVSFSSGSAALYAVAVALRTSSSDMVVTTPNTFVATAAAFASYGSSVRFVDIDSHGNMDVEGVAKIGHRPSTRGKTIFVPVHFAGVAIDMKAFSERMNSQNVFIVEDAAHAIGSRYPTGEMVGSCVYSDMTIFSFHASKNITCGEGGMVTTNNKELFERLRSLRDSGIVRHPKMWYSYSCEDLHCNAHLTQMGAALGSSQLLRIDSFEKTKKRHIDQYRTLLTHFPGIHLPPSDVDQRTHYHLFVVKVDFYLIGKTREDVMDRMRENGIMTQYHYIPLYRHPALQAYIRASEEPFLNMDDHENRALSLPLYVAMTEDDINTVVKTLWNVLYT